MSSMDKNETSRFLGEGVSFKAKLIGILEVSEARGDRMCQEALSDLKMAIRAAGEHKQRITINIAIEGLRLRDEKTGDSLYHHPVHKISFIAQDMTDSRAFGYIFGSPDTGHRFFGIKTDKAASQVVIAMRDLFQVVFALKKKEIELAKQHLDKNRYGVMSIFSDSTLSNTKTLLSESTSKGSSEHKATGAEGKTTSPAVADLVDLELELNSLQQGISQMERITPSDPFGSKDDPFGDSFSSYTPKPILPPPPPGKERSSRTSDSSSIFSPKTPHTAGNSDLAADSSLFSSGNFTFPTDTKQDDTLGSGDWFSTSAIGNLEKSLTSDVTLTKDQQHELTKQEILSQFDVFTDLDPLGTGKSKPYVDKKDFFRELKNPPKKVLNDLVVERQPQENRLFPSSFEQNNGESRNSSGINETFNSDPFDEDPFDKTDPFAEADFEKDPFDTTEFRVFNRNHSEKFTFDAKIARLPSPQPNATFSSQDTFNVKFPKKSSEVHENRSLDMSSEPDIAPEPPPRPTVNIFQIKPPPLPPKKQEFSAKPPPRPPYSEDIRYDYMENYQTALSNIENVKKPQKVADGPPLPAPSRKNKIDLDYFKTTPERPAKDLKEDDYLTPISISKQKKEYRSVARNTGPLLQPPPSTRSTKKMSRESAIEFPFPESVSAEKPTSLDSLNITLSQLTLSGLNDLATKLEIPPSKLSNMTLAQLTDYLSQIMQNRSSPKKIDEPASFANFNDFDEMTKETHDKYAVFRELLEEGIKETKVDVLQEEIEEEHDSNRVKETSENQNNADRYAALREIVDDDIKKSILTEDSIDESITNEGEIEDQTNLNNISEEDEEEIEENEEEEEEGKKLEEVKNETNKLFSENQVLSSPKDEVIELVDTKKTLEKDEVFFVPEQKLKSPIPAAVADIIQTSNRLTSGSLSDVVSGSSPEVDPVGSTSEVTKKSTDMTGGSWAIFDQTNVSHQPSREKQSEDGVSPWSSDSKEFGNGSPPEWRNRVDSGSDKWLRQKHEREGWWDPSAEPDFHYPAANRKSTDSYEDDGYDYYERPRRHKQHWDEKATGGHSSSSRDVSPWEEDPQRDSRKYGREMWTSRYMNRPQHGFERRDRKHADSWDEEDDYEYDEEHLGRYHWPERHLRDMDERSRDRDGERWADDWREERKVCKRRDLERDRKCCPDWEENDPEYYNNPRWRPPDRKHEERYHPRDSQAEPQWEGDYLNEHEEYRMGRLSAKKNWKRPSSASEMDRKSGENKGRHGQYYFGTGGSDGERDRRCKAARRSRSRDSQQSESSQSRYRPEPSQFVRPTHRLKLPHHKAEDFPPHKKIEEPAPKRIVTLSRKKSPKSEEPIKTFPRKSRLQHFENDFVPPEPTGDFNSSKKKSKNDRPLQKSPFDDDFSPGAIPERVGKEDANEEEDDSFGDNNFIKSNIKKKLNKSRFSSDIGLKKSESVNIFARESDPFDDDFFSEETGAEQRWTEKFDDFDVENGRNNS